MPFLVATFRDEEVTRRELTGPLVIGRSPDCDIVVRDILLSRRHCRIGLDEGTGTWSVQDLGSKNGSWINGEQVQFAVLKDGTSVRIGKTTVRFYTGNLKPAPVSKKPSNGSRRRPADPFEALSGTVTDFEFKPDGPERDVSRLPTPAPQPADPASYQNEDVYSLLTEIASSSWDSIYATASGPAAVMVAGQTRRPLPVAGVKVVGSDVVPRRRHVVADPCLQVGTNDSSVGIPATDAIGLSSVDEKTAVMLPAVSAAPAKPARWNPLRSVTRAVTNVLTGRIFRRSH
jgi:pSer/pThr/pTyr-binding forkhead associated (FHA) protein